MDHIVYLDYKAKELYNLTIGKKSLMFISPTNSQEKHHLN